MNKMGDFDIQERSWIDTSLESNVLKDKVYIEDLDPGKLTYVVQSNKKSLDSANEILDSLKYEKSLNL